MLKQKILIAILLFILSFAITGCGEVKTSTEPDAEVHNARFNFWLTIPSEWKASDRSVNGDGYFIECGNENIDMRVYGSYAVLPQDYYLNTDDGSVVADFLFDGGIVGWQKQKADTYIQFFYYSNARYITFHLNYQNDPVWFNENEEKINLIAKTLRDGYIEPFQTTSFELSNYLVFPHNGGRENVIHLFLDDEYRSIDEYPDLISYCKNELAEANAIK